MYDLSEKKIAVLGLGIEGQDICQFLLDNEAGKITVFDQKTALELGEPYERFKKLGVLFNLGKDYLKSGLLGFNLIFRSPGFKLSLPEISEAKKAGISVSSDTKLFFDLCPGKIIGVTGTKGKGTTTALIYEILKQSGKKVFLAGNIGQPMLFLIPRLNKDSWVVLELSSFQLQDLSRSPQIAVVLFITSEHLDYHQDTQEYIEAKTNIICHQQKEDFAVLNADNTNSSSFASLTESKVYYFSRTKKVDGSYVTGGEIYLKDQLVGKVEKLLLRGAHNWDNVCAAITASWLAEANLESIKKAVFSFKGLEHRLELVENIGGVTYYNDSFSTTPETTTAAIKSFKEPLVLVAGGSEKGSDYDELGKEIAKSTAKCLILIGDMAKRIKKAVLDAGYKGEIVYQPGNMEAIIRVASEKAKTGGVVLLSPACASFGLFKNYKDRGGQFKKYVKALKSHSQEHF